MFMNNPGCLPAAGTATKDFSDSRGLNQLVDFSTHGSAILKLVLYGHQGSVQPLPNHVVLMVTISISNSDFAAC